MTDTLLNAVRRYAEAHADAAGIARTPIPGLTAIRAAAPSGLDYAISRPLLALVLQGSKQVAMGRETFTLNAGESLLIAADVPTVSRITRATIAEPYISFVVDLDLAVIAELTAQVGASSPDAEGARVRVLPNDAEIADAALRLIRLIDRREAASVLQTQPRIHVRSIDYAVSQLNASASTTGVRLPRIPRIISSIAILGR